MASGTLQTGRTLKYMTTFAGTATSVPTATDTIIAEYPLPAGSHMLEITFTFQKTDGNGSRKAMYQINNGTVMNLVEGAPASDGFTTVCAISLYTNASDATLKVIARQTSGSAMNVRAWVNDMCFN